MPTDKFPYCVTVSEIRRLVGWVKYSQPDCRYGQAICNKYKVDPILEDLIYQDDDLGSVADKIFKHYYRADYQNL